MAMTVNSAVVTLSGSVTTTPSLPKPSTTQTVVNYFQANKGAGDVTLLTVAAGHAFYVMGANMMCPANTTNLSIQNTATTIAYLGVAVGYNTSSVSGGGCPIAKIAAGETLVLSGGTGSYINVWGFDEVI